MRKGVKKALLWIVAAIIASLSKSPQKLKSTVVSPRRGDTGEDSILIPEEKLTSREIRELKELYKLLIQRIYHEDILLQMRNYNFITANVFLGAGFVFVTSGETEAFGYVIAAVGFLWGLLQVVYGKMQVTATNLWRKQAWMVEDVLDTKFDSTLYELYQLGKTKIPFAQFETIKMTSERTRPPYEDFPYMLPFLLGFNMPFAVTVPWMTAALWIALMVILLINQKASPWVVVPVAAVMASLLVLSSLCRTAYPPSMLYGHIAVRHGRKTTPELFRLFKISVFPKFKS